MESMIKDKEGRVINMVQFQVGESKVEDRLLPGDGAGFAIFVHG